MPLLGVRMSRLKYLILCSLLFTSLSFGVEYGNVGDPYEGGSFNPTGKTALSACATLASGTSYYLTGNVGVDPTITCFDMTGTVGTTLDLRDYTVTGRIASSYGIKGATVFNGLVNCNYLGSGANIGCIRLYSDSPNPAKSRVHHLTPHNADTSNPWGIFIEGTGVQGANIAFEVDHITGYVGTALTSTRCGVIRLIVGDKVDIHNNDITCNADASACQGIEVPASAGYVNGLIHHNRIVMTTNTTAESGRGITISGPDSGSVGSQGWQIYSNLITANNNRAIRLPQVNNAVVRDNIISDCSAGASGCYHLGDPSGGVAYVNDAQTVIYNEAIGMTGGTAFWARDGQGWMIRNSTVTGANGKLGALLTAIQTPNHPTGASFCSIIGTLGTASTAAASTTVSTFNSGVWTGAGTINTPGICDIGGGGGTPSVALSASSLVFGSQIIGTTSLAQVVTLLNNGTAILNITSIGITGDFAKTSTCGLTLAAGASCTITTTFTPTIAGARTGTITIIDSVGTQTVSLAGTGIVTPPVPPPPPTPVPSATVTGNIASVNGGIIFKDVFVRFELRNYGRNVPRAAGIIVPSFVNVYPNNSGVINTAIAGNDIITPTGTYYSICYYQGGKKYYCCNAYITGAAVSLNSLTCK